MNSVGSSNETVTFRAEDAAVLEEALVDELRLRGLAAYQRVRRAAVARLALFTGQPPREPRSDELSAATRRFCCARGVGGLDELGDWAAEQGVSEADLAGLIWEEATLFRMVDELAWPIVRRAIITELKLSSEYADLAGGARAAIARAREPRRAGIAECRQLIAWYEVRTRQTCSQIPSVDAECLDLDDGDAFIRLLSRAYPGLGTRVKSRVDGPQVGFRLATSPDRQFGRDLPDGLGEA